MTVNNLLVSEDSRYLAYTIDTTGEELYNLYIKDLSTGQVEIIQRNVYSFCFGLSRGAARDLYYTVANNLMRTNRVYRHVLGSSATHDVPVFEEPSAVYYCDVKRTNDCVSAAPPPHSEIHAVLQRLEVGLRDFPAETGRRAARSAGEAPRAGGVGASRAREG